MAVRGHSSTSNKNCVEAASENQVQHNFVRKRSLKSTPSAPTLFNFKKQKKRQKHRRLESKRHSAKEGDKDLHQHQNPLENGDGTSSSCGNSPAKSNFSLNNAAESEAAKAKNTGINKVPASTKKRQQQWHKQHEKMKKYILYDDEQQTKKEMSPQAQAYSIQVQR